MLLMLRGVLLRQISTKRQVALENNKRLTQSLSQTASLNDLLQHVAQHQAEFNTTNASAALFKLGKLCKLESKQAKQPCATLAQSARVQSTVELLFQRLEQEAGKRALSPRNIGNVCDGVLRAQLVPQLPSFLVNAAAQCEFVTQSSYFDKCTPLVNTMLCAAELKHTELAGKLAGALQPALVSDFTSAVCLQRIAAATALLSAAPPREVLLQVAAQMEKKLTQMRPKDLVPVLRVLDQHSALPASVVLEASKYARENEYFTQDQLAELAALAKKHGVEDSKAATA